MGVVDRSNHSLPWHQKQDLDLNFCIASSSRIVMDRVLCEAKVNCVRVLEELLVGVRLGGVLVEDNAMCSCRRQVGAVWIFALINEASLVAR